MAKKIPLTPFLDMSTIWPHVCVYKGDSELNFFKIIHINVFLMYMKLFFIIIKCIGVFSYAMPCFSIE